MKNAYEDIEQKNSLLNITSWLKYKVIKKIFWKNWLYTILFLKYIQKRKHTEVNSIGSDDAFFTEDNQVSGNCPIVNGGQSPETQ